MKKQITAILSAAALLALSAPLSASAEDAAAAGSAQITVTVAAEGALQVKAEKLTVTDVDSDGALTVNDAMLLTHDAYFDGGAAAGYALKDGFITKFWGIENGGSYGYTVNNALASGISAALKDGDAFYAYAYKDAAGYSDQYTYFDKLTAEDLKQNGTLELQLSGFVYDENWNQVIVPVAGAGITVNGKATQFTTDADGKVTLTLYDAGPIVISADSTDKIIVPPVFRAEVAADESAQTSDSTTTTTTTTTTAAATTTTAADGVAAGEPAAPAVAVALIAALALGTAYVSRRRED